MSDKIENHLLVGRRFDSARVTKTAKLVEKNTLETRISKGWTVGPLSTTYTTGSVDQGKILLTPEFKSQISEDHTGLLSFISNAEIKVSCAKAVDEYTLTTTVFEAFFDPVSTMHTCASAFRHPSLGSQLSAAEIESLANHGITDISFIGDCYVLASNDTSYYMHSVYDYGVCRSHADLVARHYFDLAMRNGVSGCHFSEKTGQIVNRATQNILNTVKRFRNRKIAAADLDRPKLEFLVRLLGFNFDYLSYVNANILSLFRELMPDLNQKSQSHLNDLVEAWTSFQKSGNPTAESLISLLSRLSDIFDTIKTSKIDSNNKDDIKSSTQDDKQQDIDLDQSNEDIIMEDTSSKHLLDLQIIKASPEVIERLDKYAKDQTAKHDGTDNSAGEIKAGENLLDQGSIDSSIKTNLKMIFDFMFYMQIKYQRWTTPIIRQSGELHCMGITNTLYFTEFCGYQIFVGKKCIVVKKNGKAEYFNFKTGEVCTHAVQSEIKNRIVIVIRNHEMFNKDWTSDEHSVRSGHQNANLTFYSCNLRSICEAFDDGFKFRDDLLASVFDICGSDCAMLNPMQSRSLSAAVFANERVLCLMIKAIGAKEHEVFDILNIHKVDQPGAVLEPATVVKTNNGDIRIKKAVAKKDDKAGDVEAENPVREPDSDDGSSDDNSDGSFELETALIIPKLTVRGNNIYALAHSSEKTFKVYWLQHKNSKLHVKSYHDDLCLNISQNNSMNSDLSVREEAMVSFVRALDNMIEKPYWIDIKGTPALLLVRLDLTIDMYIMKDLKIIKCKGLPQSFDMGLPPVLDNVLADNEDSSDDDMPGVKRAVKKMRLGWHANSRCMTMAYTSGDKKTDGKLIIKTFKVKL